MVFGEVDIEPRDVILQGNTSLQCRDTSLEVQRLLHLDHHHHNPQHSPPGRLFYDNVDMANTKIAVLLKACVFDVHLLFYAKMHEGMHRVLFPRPYLQIKVLPVLIRENTMRFRVRARLTSFVSFSAPLGAKYRLGRQIHFVPEGVERQPAEVLS